MGSVTPWAFEVGVKDFLLDIPDRATELQRWFTELRLASSRPASQVSRAGQPHDGQAQNQADLLA